MTERPADQREALLSWATIEARCSTYRDGFVRAFLEYRGRSLEGGGAVTQASFAEHFGIAERTFKLWLEKAGATKKRGGQSVTPALSENEPGSVEDQLEQVGVRVVQGTELPKSLRHLRILLPGSVTYTAVPADDPLLGEGVRVYFCGSGTPAKLVRKRAKDGADQFDLIVTVDELDIHTVLSPDEWDDQLRAEGGEEKS